MTPDETRSLRSWMEGRFDHLDAKVDDRTSALAEEIKQTRHGFRPVLEQLAIQLAELVTVSRQHDREIVQLRASAHEEIGKINDWRADEGPLDARLKRHSARQEATEGWQNRAKGAIAAMLLVVPILTGIVVGVVVTIMAQILNLGS